jgi:hypothetical protein
MAIVLDGTTGITTPDIDSTQSTLGPLTQALNLGSTGQIVFPATQNASANANTLDDYEEGTFTPTLGYVNPGTSSIVSSERFGTYTKVGRVVYFTIDFRISSFSKGTASGALQLAGLPFAQRNTSGFDSARVLIHLWSWTYSSSPVVGIMVSSGTGMELVRMVSGSATVDLNDPGGSSIVWATGFYFV